jgi:hypothetical protein
MIYSKNVTEIPTLSEVGSDVIFVSISIFLESVSLLECFVDKSNNSLLSHIKDFSPWLYFCNDSKTFSPYGMDLDLMGTTWAIYILLEDDILNSQFKIVSYTTLLWYHQGYILDAIAVLHFHFCIQATYLYS